MPIGVTTKKNINPITKGETIFPKNIPNLNQILFKGESNFEFNKPKIKKVIDIIKDHNRSSPWFKKGYIAIIKKTIKNTIPKLRLEPILISSI